MSLREQAAREAFVYGVPTVALYGVLHELVLAPDRPGRRASFNEWRTGALPTGLARLASLTPRGSTPFCGWIDLRSGPVVLTAPAGGVGGSASATVLDLYAEEVGQVPSGADPGGRSLLLAGPSWEPTLSADVAAVHRCLTDLCLVVAQVAPAEAGDPLRALHPPLLVEPLEEATTPAAPLPDPVPPVDLRLPPTVAFLVALDWMLPLMPTPPGEDELRAELESIGVGCGPDALADALAEDRLDGQLTQGLRRGWDLARRGLPNEPHGRGSTLRADHGARAVRVLTAVLGDAREGRSRATGGRAGRATVAGQGPGPSARGGPSPSRR